MRQEVLTYKLVNRLNSVVFLSLKIRIYGAGEKSRNARGQNVGLTQ